MKPSFAIIGCGRVGTALSLYLTDNGYKVAGLASRSIRSAKTIADQIHTDRFSDVLWEATKSADVVFITTPDDVIPEACRIISENNGFREGTVVLHCSGAHPSTILSDAKNCGAWIGSLHPLQSFASTKFSQNPFKGIIAAIEGEDRAVKAAGQIASDLGAVCLTIPTEAKILYHASAVVASNYLVTLMDLAFKLIGFAGLSGNDALRVLKPLVDGTLSNIEKAGAVNALTGPIARGDVETVKSHVEEISAKTPELLLLYKVLGGHTIGIADEKGTLTKESLEGLKEVLKF